MADGKCFKMIRAQLLKENPADKPIDKNILFVLGAAYSAGRLDSIGTVSNMWRKIVENLDIAEMVLNPSAYIKKLQEICDEFAQDQNLFSDLYEAKNGDNGDSTQEASKIIVG